MKALVKFRYDDPHGGYKFKEGDYGILEGCTVVADEAYGFVNVFRTKLTELVTLHSYDLVKYVDDTSEVNDLMKKEIDRIWREKYMK